MAKKPQTREELLAAIDAIDNSTEVATRDAQIADLTAERDSLLAQRKELERTVKTYRDEFETILKIVQRVDRVHRPIDDCAVTDAGQRSARFMWAETVVGVQKGTHDAATGLPYTHDTQPPRDLSAGAPKVTKAELAVIFPELSGPNVDFTDTADALLDTETGASISALEIATA